MLFGKTKIFVKLATSDDLHNNTYEFELDQIYKSFIFNVNGENMSYNQY